MDPSDVPSSAPPPAGSGPSLFWTERRRRIARWAAAGSAAFVAAFAVYLGVLTYTTPGVDELRKAQGAWPSVILSADGEVIGRFSTAYQAPVALKDVAPDLINALIATEDHRFYDHRGLDPTRIVGSIWRSAVIASRNLRFRLRSLPISCGKRLRASCCVIVEPPCRSPWALRQIEPTMRVGSSPWCS